MEEIKAFNIRLSRDLWKFLKKDSIDQEMSMNQIIITCLEKYKLEKRKKKLTGSDTVVS